jgi:signal transduction histidine kinase
MRKKEVRPVKSAGLQSRSLGVETAKSKKPALPGREGKSRARLVEELRTAQRKIAVLKRKSDDLEVSRQLNLGDNPEQKRAEEALKRSQRELQAIYENAPTMMCVLDPSLRVLFVNRAFAEFVGRPVDKIKGERACGIIGCLRALDDPRGCGYGPHCATCNVRLAMVDALATGRAYRGIEYRTTILRHGQPRELVFLASVAPLKISEQGSMLLCLEEITELDIAGKALRKSEANLRALAIELSRTEERERHRLAISLHDEVGQSLALLRMKFGDLAGASRSKFEKTDIKAIRNILEKLIEQTQTLTFELSPPVLHQLGLEAAIEWLGEKICRDHGIQFAFRDDGRTKRLDDGLNALVLRCIRELMMNTVKHAKASGMAVSLKRTKNAFCAVIEDDGIGFETAILEKQKDLPGFGLFSVRENFAAAGGSFQLQSKRGRGTRVILSIPLEKETSPGGES